MRQPRDARSLVAGEGVGSTPPSAHVRICLVTESFPPIIGGGEAHAHLLSAALARLGADVHVVTRRRLAHSPRRERPDGYLIVRLAPTGMPRLGKYLMMPGTLWWLLTRARQYDVIYVCGLRTLGVVARVAGWVTRKPCLLRSESCTELSGEYAWGRGSGAAEAPRGRVGGAVLRALIGMRNCLLRRADGFVAISGAIRDEYLDCGVPAARIARIPNGIDTVRFAPADPAARAALRRRFGLEAKWACVYTGKLNRGKGLELLLASWTRVAARYPGAHLLLVGGGAHQFLSCEKELREMVSTRGLEERVTFTGNVTNVHEYLQTADCFVLPSDSEAMPLSLVEAMAVGLPCIASRAGGMVEVIEHERNGLLFAIQDGEALTEALCRLRKDRDLAQRLGTAARRSAASRYGIAQIAERHLAWFGSLIETREATGAG